MACKRHSYDAIRNTNSKNYSSNQTVYNFMQYSGKSGKMKFRLLLTSPSLILCYLWCLAYIKRIPVIHKLHKIPRLDKNFLKRLTCHSPTMLTLLKMRKLTWLFWQLEKPLLKYTFALIQLFFAPYLHMCHMCLKWSHHCTSSIFMSSQWWVSTIFMKP